MTTSTTASRSVQSEPSPSSPGRVTCNPWSALIVLMSGTFMFVLDFFIVNVALPSIQHGLHAGEGAIEWVVAGYAISIAVLLVTGGRLGDQFGRRRVFALGMAIFVITSAGCALAPDPAALVAARVVQGVGAALMAPNILSILGVVYTGPARVRAISVYGMVMGLAATSGQLIGGILIRTDVAGLGWRTIFWINVPLGVAALLAAPRLVPESRAERGSRLDLTGVVLITACLVAVVLPLVEGRQAGWPAWSWAMLGAAVPLAVVFAVHQRRKAARGGTPLLNPRIFASWPLRAGLFTQTVFWCQQAAGYLVLGLYLQQGRGLSPLAAGRSVHLPGRWLPGHVVPGPGADHALRPLGDRGRGADRGSRRRRPVPGHGARRYQRTGRLAVSRAAAARSRPGAVHHPADHHGAEPRRPRDGRIGGWGPVHRPAGR